MQIVLPLVLNFEDHFDETKVSLMIFSFILFIPGVWSYIKPGDEITKLPPHIDTYTTTKLSTTISDNLSSTLDSAAQHGNGSITEKISTTQPLSTSNADTEATKEDNHNKLPLGSTVAEMIPSIKSAAELESHFQILEKTMTGYAGVIPDRRKRGMVVNKVIRDENPIEKKEMKTEVVKNTKQNAVTEGLLKIKDEVVGRISNEGLRHNGEQRDDSREIVTKPRPSVTTTETVQLTDKTLSVDIIDTIPTKELDRDEDEIETTQSEDEDDDIEEHHEADKSEMGLEHNTARLSVEYHHGLYDNDERVEKPSLGNKREINDKREVNDKPGTTEKNEINVNDVENNKQTNDVKHEAKDKKVEEKTKSDGVGKQGIPDIGTELPEYPGTIPDKSSSLVKLVAREESSAYSKAAGTVTMSPLDRSKNIKYANNEVKTNQDTSDLPRNTIVPTDSTGIKLDKIEKRDLWDSMIAKGKELLGNEEGITTRASVEHTNQVDTFTKETSRDSTSQDVTITNTLVTGTEHEQSIKPEETLTTQTGELDKEQTGVTVTLKGDLGKEQTELTVEQTELTVDQTSTEITAQPTPHEEKPVPEFYNQFQHHMRQLRPRRKFPNPNV